MNDVFISYRRHNGEAWASHIKDLLEKRGVKCYLDKNKKKTKDFKDALLKNIKQSNNFLLILSEDVFEPREEDVDWVRDEIAYARENDKNIVAVMFNGYDPSNVNWKDDERISFLETYECLLFNDTNINLRDASVTSIIEYLVDEHKKPWRIKLKDNNNWYGDTISDEDRLWMYTSMEVCKKMDAHALTQILKNPVISCKKVINYFVLMAYDIDSIAKRTTNYIARNDNLDLPEIRVFGLCHKADLEYANETFGSGHFIEFGNESNVGQRIKSLLAQNKISSFDIVDMALILKDFEDPKSVMKQITEHLNSSGSAVYIRDLDDDLVVAYPDDAGLVKKAIEYLSLDPGAGNRHFGKKIYTFLCKSGADEVRMTDDDVSTANFKVSMQRKICDAYFSYLVPEFKCLVQKHPDNEDYADALNWLELHYSELESLFESREFYFRAGFISGFGIYKDDDFFED